MPAVFPSLSLLSDRVSPSPAQNAASTSLDISPISIQGTPTEDSTTDDETESDVHDETCSCLQGTCNCTEPISWAFLDQRLCIVVYGRLFQQMRQTSLVGRMLGLSDIQLAEVVAGHNKRIIHPGTESDIWKHCLMLTGPNATAIDPRVLQQNMAHLQYAANFEDFSESARHQMQIYLKSRGLVGSFTENLLPSPGMPITTANTPHVQRLEQWLSRTEHLDQATVRHHLSADLCHSLRTYEADDVPPFWEWVQDGIKAYCEEDTIRSVEGCSLPSIKDKLIMKYLHEIHRQLKKCKLPQPEPRFLAHCFGSAVHLSAQAISDVGAILRITSDLQPDQQDKVITSLKAELTSDINNDIWRVAAHAFERCQIETACEQAPETLLAPKADTRPNTQQSSTTATIATSPIPTRKTPWISGHASTHTAKSPRRPGWESIDTARTVIGYDSPIQSTNTNRSIEPTSRPVSTQLIFGNDQIAPELFEMNENLNNLPQLGSTSSKYIHIQPSTPGQALISSIRNPATIQHHATHSPTETHERPTILSPAAMNEPQAALTSTTTPSRSKTTNSPLKRLESLTPKHAGGDRNANLPSDARTAIAMGKSVYKERKDKGVKRGPYMTKARKAALHDILTQAAN